MIANALKRPFYVAVESYKFTRLYPLSQRDVLDLSGRTIHKHNITTTNTTNNSSNSNSSELESNINMLEDNLKQINITSHNNNNIIADIMIEFPKVDFTPANLITLLFTDLGVLTPAAISDELIRLYQ